MKPDYRIRVEIYDDECGEIISRIDQPMMTVDEDNISNARTAIEVFKQMQPGHEETYYPKEITV